MSADATPSMTSACVADNKPGPAMVNETTAVGPRPVARALTFTRESPSAGALGAESESESEACCAGTQPAAATSVRVARSFIKTWSDGPAV